MADDLNHVGKGQSVLPAVKADTWNAFVDAARDYKARKFSSGGVLINESVHPSLTALVRNDTGGDLSAGYVVALSDKIGDPVNEPMTFRQRPAFAGDIPAASTDLIGILAEPIRDGEIGRVVVMGVAVCDVLINDAAHGYAVPIAADETKLESADSGPARIEWKETSGSTRRAIVLLLNDAAAIAGLRVLGGTSGDISAVTKLTVGNAVLTGTAAAAILTPDPAGVGASGIITTGSQTIAGEKTFLDGIVVGTGVVATDRTIIGSDGGTVRVISNESGVGDYPTIALHDGNTWPAANTNATIQARRNGGDFIGELIVKVTTTNGGQSSFIFQVDDNVLASDFILDSPVGFTAQPRFVVWDTTFVGYRAGIKGTGGGGDKFAGGICYELGAAITPFTDEAAQDAVGGILTNSSTITLAYSDATPSITATVADSGITPAKLSTASLALMATMADFPL